MPKFAMYLGSFISSEYAEFYKAIDNLKTYDNFEAKEILKIKFTDLKMSILEMGDSLINTGYLAKM
jgi:hypothetical protein